MTVNGPTGQFISSVPNHVMEGLKSGNEEKESNLKMLGNLVLVRPSYLKNATLNHAQIQVSSKHTMYYIILNQNIISVIDCQWSLWSSWSSCSVSCGRGQREKSRSTQNLARNGGKDCVGASRNTQSCSTSRQCPRRIPYYEDTSYDNRYPSISRTQSRTSIRCRNQRSGIALWLCENIQS